MGAATITDLDPLDGLGTPVAYHGSWIWPVDGYYDVHGDGGGRPDDWPTAEYLSSLAEAQAWIDDDLRTAAFERALDRAFGGES